MKLATREVFNSAAIKLKKLQGEYKNIKDNKTGEDRSNWDCFDTMDAIIKFFGQQTSYKAYCGNPV